MDIPALGISYSKLVQARATPCLLVSLHIHYTWLHVLLFAPDHFLKLEGGLTLSIRTAKYVVYINLTIIFLGGNT